MGSGFSKMRKQARMMEEQISKMREEMEKTEFNGSAGNGLVEVVVDGDKKLKKISIKPECMDPSDPEGLQDLVFGALQDAYAKADDAMGQMGGGGLPFFG